MARLIRLCVIGAGIDRRLENLIGSSRLRPIGDFARAGEHEGDRPRLAEIAAIFGEQRAHHACRAVAVVGERLDHDCRTARPVAFIADRFVIFRLAARRLLDGALDIVFRHVLGACILDSESQTRILFGIGQTCPRRYRDLAGELREQLRADGVLLALPVHDILELRMAGHVAPLPRSGLIDAGRAA